MTDQVIPPSGHEVIQAYLKTLDASPGVYRMLNTKGEVLYVGKARNLRARVTNYARTSGHSLRIARMIFETCSMLFLTTRTETEALLLEQNLIKQLKPRYNVLRPSNIASEQLRSKNTFCNWFSVRATAPALANGPK